MSGPDAMRLTAWLECCGQTVELYEDVQGDNVHHERCTGNSALR